MSSSSWRVRRRKGMELRTMGHVGKTESVSPRGEIDRGVEPGDCHPRPCTTVT